MYTIHLRDILDNEIGDFESDARIMVEDYVYFNKLAYQVEHTTVFHTPSNSTIAVIVGEELSRDFGVDVEFPT